MAKQSLVKRLVDEIRDKASDYETSMRGFMDRVGEWGDLFQVKRPAKRDVRTFSNPRLTEFHRAGVALGTMMYRMQTAQDPFFEARPVSPLEGDDQLLRIEGVLNTQLEESKYKENLLSANIGVCVFGTQIVQEDYETVGINRFGRRIPVTTFTPRSLLQTYFDRSATDIDNADWLMTTDLVSSPGLMRLAQHAEELKQPWEEKVIEFAAKEEDRPSDFSPLILERLRSLRYLTHIDRVTRKELLMYYGKFDALNDGVEYVAALVNRKHLIRFHPNRNQHGKRNFRVAYWLRDPMRVDPLGLGLGILSDHHRAMDANRQKLQDGVAFASYNMWYRQRSAGIDDQALKIRPLQIIDGDGPQGLVPLGPDPSGLNAALKLEELLRDEFMAASGATKTLQAQVTDATASEVSLAQNEAVRSISVRAEIIAEQFVREHLSVMHANNVEFMRAPVSINRAGFAGLVYPRDLRVDLDFQIKIVTDKDYRPKRLEHLIQTLQILVSTKSAHPDQLQISILPIVQEIARLQGIPANQVILPVPRQPIPGMLGAEGTGAGIPGPSGFAPDQGLPVDQIQTPVGPVLGSANA
jgi:hypothetical protein